MVLKKRGLNKIRRVASLSIATLCLMTFLTSPTLGMEEPKCPQRVAAFDGTIIPVEVIAVFKKMYSDLDCEPTYVPLPGRRGIIQFNHGKVDGEIFRTEKIEPLYTREFVKSAIPVFTISNSLWRNPSAKQSKKKKIGYVLGIVWQEKFKTVGVKKSYHNAEKMYEAYNSGLLTEFLSSNYSLTNE